MENWRESKLKGYVIWQYIGKNGCDITIKKNKTRIAHLTTNDKHFLTRHALKEIIEDAEETLRNIGIEQ